MAQGSAFGTPLLDSQKSSGGKYAYRHRMGLTQCAEFDVFHDDFHSFMVGTAITNGPVANTPLDFWAGAIIDSGATIVATTTATLGANGAITIADATAAEGAALYSTKSFQLISGKRFFVECRFRTGDVTDNTFQFGLSDQTAVTNPEDLWTTTAASLAAFGILDGSAYPTMLADKANTGSAAQAQTNKLLTVNTWHTLAIGYDGTSLAGYVDGDRVLTWGTAAAVPTATAMGLFIGHINGDGAGAAVVIVDYIRAVSER